MPNRNSETVEKRDRKMGISIEKADFYGRHILATIQDYGRYGYQNSGVTVSGVVDRRSASKANVLVNNDIREAVIEFMLMGPTIKFTSSAHIAITGADFSPKLNGESIANYKAIKVKAGDVLEFGFAKGGVWGYVAFAEKLSVPQIMGSRSTNTRTGIGGIQGRALEEGDTIEFREKIKSLPNFEKRELEPENFGNKEKEIRVILGLQQDAFTKKGIETFLNSTYRPTSECDRMGYRMEGPVIEHINGADITSDGISLGAIQVPGSGTPIVMLTDRQTTGGYTKIGTVIGVDIPDFVQSVAGTEIHFKEISVVDAQDLYIGQFEYFNKLKNDLAKESFFTKLKHIFA